MSIARNIAFAGGHVAKFFAAHRVRWSEFYPSEHFIFERLAGPERRFGKVLDVGCAVGGLGLALEERFSVGRYVGVEISRKAIDAARVLAKEGRFRCPVAFHAGDILATDAVEGGPFDLVVALSSADWNIETDAILRACWDNVAPGGTFVMSLRLTDGRSLNDISRSYQELRYEEGEAPERANYVVFGVREILRLFEGFSPRASNVLGYGTWGPPSRTAVTPYHRLCFTVFAVTKAKAPAGEIATELHFPASLWSGVET